MTHHFIAPLRRWAKWLLFAGLILFFAYISWCTPFTGDDMEFASLQFETIEEYWTYISQYGNGRFLGNILAVAMPYLPFLRIWIKAAVLASCVMLLPQVLGMDSVMATCLSFLLFVGVDGSLFGEVYSWASGFSNYITPVWLTLIILFVMTRPSPVLRSGPVKVLIILPLAVCSQLFMEHASAVNLLLALCAVVKAHRDKSVSRLAAWSWLTGACIGLAIMLLGPSLFYIPENHTASYRGVFLGSLPEILASCLRNAMRLAAYYLNANSLPICLGCAATLFLTRDRRSPKGNRVMTLLWALSTGYIAFCAGQGLDDYFGSDNLVYHFLCMCMLLLLIGVWLVAVWQLGRGVLRERLLLCLGFGLVALAPILIVHPVPMRVLFQSYIFFAAGAMLCADALRRSLDLQWLNRGRIAAVLAAAIYIVNLSCIYTFIAHAAKLREDYIQDQIAQGAECIRVFTIEYDYVFDDCMDGLTILYYQKLAGYPVAFEQITQTQWLGNYA